MEKTLLPYTRPLFSTKHYKAIALMCHEDAVSYHTIVALARLFEQDNPKFDKKRFYKAAGVED